jgi:hypothetical protein
MVMVFGITTKFLEAFVKNDGNLSAKTREMRILVGGLAARQVCPHFSPKFGIDQLKMKCGSEMNGKSGRISIPEEG